MANIAEKVISNFNGKSIMEGIDKNQLKEFTQKYYNLIVLSGRKIEKKYANIRIDAFPYINDKKTKEDLSKRYKEYATTEDILLYFKASENQELYITEKGIYFNMFDLVDEECKYGVVPFENISSLDVVQKGDYFCLECNGILLITDDVKNKDFYEDIDLKEYTKHLTENNLTISETEMIDGTKRHIDVSLYGKIKQRIKKSNILNVSFSVDSGYICVIVCEGFCEYEISNGVVSLEGNFKRFKDEKFYEISHGEMSCISWDMFGGYYVTRQMDAVIQYMNELSAEEEKEKAIEEDIQKQVEKLVKLKTIGLLTDKEFEEKRLALLERMGI